MNLRGSWFEKVDLGPPIASQYKALWRRIEMSDGEMCRLVEALQRVVWARGVSRLVEKHWRSNQQVEERARYLQKLPRLRPPSKVYEVYEGRRARQ